MNYCHCLINVLYTVPTPTQHPGAELVCISGRTMAREDAQIEGIDNTGSPIAARLEHTLIN